MEHKELILVFFVKQEPVIVGGMSCINSDFQEKKEKMDPYTLALVAYANSLHQSNSEIGHEIVNVLESKAKRNGKYL